MGRKKEEMDLAKYLKMTPRHFGLTNKDKTIYFICENNGALGFFAMYRYWLEYLYFADICGYHPVISGGNKFAYKEEERVHGKKNPFEYYFYQPVGIELKQVKSSYYVISSHTLHRKIIELVYTGRYSNYFFNSNYMQVMGGIVKKYMKFNDKTWQFITSGLNKLDFVGKKIIGVHVRGTDFRSNYNKHPVYVTAEDCFSEIERISEEKSYDKIFLATDDKRILNQFIVRYGDRVCYYVDVVRNDRNKSVIFEENNTKNYKYRLGLEVIRDMYTLAKCDALVAGISQVAICAQLNKLAMEEAYEDIAIIDKGINKNLRDFNSNNFIKNRQHKKYFGIYFSKAGNAVIRCTKRMIK